MTNAAEPELPALFERGYGRRVPGPLEIWTIWTRYAIEASIVVSPGVENPRSYPPPWGPSLRLHGVGGRGEADMTRDEVMALIGSRGDLSGVELRGRDFARVNLSRISGEGADSLAHP